MVTNATSTKTNIDGCVVSKAWPVCLASAPQHTCSPAYHSLHTSATHAHTHTHT